MKPRIVTIAGKPHLVIISYQEYVGLLEAADKQVPKQPLDFKKATTFPKQTDLPEEVQRRIHKGESPVKAWRLYRDLTQVELAELAGVSHSTISLVESKERSGSIETRIAIARALNVPEHLLFDDLE